MTILVTGASGHLGSHLVPALLSDGFTVRGLDVLPLPEGYPECEFVQADLCDRDRLDDALRDVDVIAHTASIHPWKSYTDDQYLDANVKGTWHLYNAAAAAGIKRIVLTSSIAAAGYGISTDDWPVTEDRSFTLSDIYSYTKHVQEDIAQLYVSAGNVRTIALRPPAFMPRPPESTCQSMIGPFCVVDDIVTAHAAAVRVMAGKQDAGAELEPFEAFYTVNRVPYNADMCRDVDGDLERVVQTCWPDAYDWIIQRGFGGKNMMEAYDITKAERVLGWVPAFNFDEAYARLQTGASGI